MQNAQTALATERFGKQSQHNRLVALQALLGMSVPPERIECFDISHTQGEAAVASNVVFNAEGPVPGQYRRFNISDITPGDDYAAMHQALERRFKRALEQGILPDVLLIDGGEGQLAQARDVLDSLGIGSVVLVGVAKGAARKAGDETLIFSDGRQLKPGADSPALQLVQQVRDEAHRFAITGHRGRRQKTRDTSKLEDIEGELREICHSHERPIKFIKDELSKSVRIHRSFLRAARYIKRIQDDEKAPAHSRVVELFIPDEFVPRGAGKNGLGHREHVVPCVLLRDKCVKLFKNDSATIEEVADFLKRYVVIVEISPSQQHCLDASKSKGGRGLKHCMPTGWEFESGCIFSRLHDANILFDPPQGFTACCH